MTHWPKEITIPDRVGVLQVYNDDGSPCCAKGHFHREMKTAGVLRRDHLKVVEAAYGKQYLRAYGALTGRNEVYVGLANDTLPTNHQRVLVYLTAWALLGYTEGMPRAVLRSMRKVQKKGAGE